METVWIITFDEVCDFEAYDHNPLVFRDEAEARKELEVYKKSLQEDYKEDIEEEYVVYYEDKNSAEVYGDEYAREHYRIRLSCASLR